jgi:hypothetical protein
MEVTETAQARPDNSLEPTRPAAPVIGDCLARVGGTSDLPYCCLAGQSVRRLDSVPPRATEYDVEPENHKAIIHWLFGDVWSRADFDRISLYLVPLHRLPTNAPM